MPKLFTPPVGVRPQGVAGDCNSLAETHAWFDSRVAHHFTKLLIYLYKRYPKCIEAFQRKMQFRFVSRCLAAGGIATGTY
jgi:hypothetical protein